MVHSRRKETVFTDTNAVSIARSAPYIPNALVIFTDKIIWYCVIYYSINNEGSSDDNRTANMACMNTHKRYNSTAANSFAYSTVGAHAW